MSEHHDVARDIAEDILATERAFAPAIVALGNFFSRLPAYEASVDVSPTNAQPVYETMAKAVSALVDGRREVVRGHRHLLHIGRANGIIPATAVGSDDCPPSNSPNDAEMLPQTAAPRQRRL